MRGCTISWKKQRTELQSTAYGLPAASFSKSFSAGPRAILLDYHSWATPGRLQKSRSSILRHKSCSRATHINIFTNKLSRGDQKLNRSVQLLPFCATLEGQASIQKATMVSRSPSLSVVGSPDLSSPWPRRRDGSNASEQQARLLNTLVSGIE